MTKSLGRAISPLEGTIVQISSQLSCNKIIWRGEPKHFAKFLEINFFIRAHAVYHSYLVAKSLRGGSLPVRHKSHYLLLTRRLKSYAASKSNSTWRPTVFSNLKIDHHSPEFLEWSKFEGPRTTSLKGGVITFESDHDSKILKCLLSSYNQRMRS